MGNCEFPEVSEKFLRDFIRGFLDGDGWITTSKERREISVGFSNTSSGFMKKLVKKLNIHLNLSTNNLRTKKKIIKNNKISITYQIDWYCLNAFKIIKFLYDDLKEDDLYLKRKFTKQVKAREIYSDVLREGSKKYKAIEDKYGKPIKELLQKLLLEEKRTGVEIAEILGVHLSTIYRWLEKTKVRLPKKKIRRIVEKICLICGNKFKVPKGYSKKYCSECCMLSAVRTGKIVKCAVCGKEIYRPGWWFELNNTALCSQECAGEWQSMRIEKGLVHRSQKTGRFISSKLKGIDEQSSAS